MATEDEVPFINAKRVLDKLKELGVREPSVTLFFDGSGRFHLGPRKKLQEVNAGAVYDIIGSSRVSVFSTEEDIQIDFCESLKGELR